MGDLSRFPNFNDFKLYFFVLLHDLRQSIYYI